MLCDTKEFVINLTTEKLVRATDYCGVKSGREVDKFKETGLTREKASHVGVPMIKESPVCIGSGKSKNWEATAHLLPMCLQSM